MVTRRPCLFTRYRSDGAAARPRGWCRARRWGQTGQRSQQAGPWAVPPTPPPATCSRPAPPAGKRLLHPPPPSFRFSSLCFNFQKQDSCCSPNMALLREAGLICLILHLSLCSTWLSAFRQGVREISCFLPLPKQPVVFRVASAPGSAPGLRDVMGIMTAGGGAVGGLGVPDVAQTKGRRPHMGRGLRWKWHCFLSVRFPLHPRHFFGKMLNTQGFQRFGGRVAILSFQRRTLLRKARIIVPDVANTLVSTPLWPGFVCGASRLH